MSKCHHFLNVLRRVLSKIIKNFKVLDLTILKTSYTVTKKHLRCFSPFAHSLEFPPNDGTVKSWGDMCSLFVSLGAKCALSTCILAGQHFCVNPKLDCQQSADMYSGNSFLSLSLLHVAIFLLKKIYNDAYTSSCIM